MERFRWLAAAAASICSPAFDVPVEGPLGSSGQPMSLDGRLLAKVFLDRGDAEELEAIDRLRPGARSLRVGWLYVAGTRVDGEDGRRRRVFVPLVTRPVRVVRSRLGRGSVIPAGDVELTELIDDRDVRHRLEEAIPGWRSGRPPSVNVAPSAAAFTTTSSPRPASPSRTTTGPGCSRRRRGCWTRIVTTTKCSNW